LGRSSASADCGSGEPVIDRDSEVPVRRRLALLPSTKHAGGGWPDEGRFKIAGGRLGKAKAQGSLCPVGRLTAVAPEKDSRKGQSPEVAARRSAPLDSSDGITAGETACGSTPAGMPGVPCGRRTLRRAKSHERCRNETSPVSRRRAETVKRAAKPCRRNVAGRQNLRIVDLRRRHVL